MKSSDERGQESRPLAVDLFSGAGGLTLGFEEAGFEVAASVEFDPVHAAVHQFNFPQSAMFCKSVSDITGSEIRQGSSLGNREVFVVFGGPPCQGISLMGKRDIHDARNSLLFEFVRLVEELDPRHFVMENVEGLVKGKYKGLLDEVVSRFRDAGYDVCDPFILQAADFGVPQSRRRLFLCGSKKGLPLPEKPSPVVTPRSVRGEVKAGRLPIGPSVVDALGDLPNADDFPELEEGDAVQASFGKPSSYAMKLRDDACDPDNFGHSRIWKKGLLTSSARTKHTERSKRRFSETAPGSVEPVSRFLRLHPKGISNTLRAGTASDRGAYTAPRPIHPRYPRVITVREAARLHGYPDWFRFHTTKWNGFREIGNSVPVFLGRAVAAQLLKAEGLEPVKGEPLAVGDESLLSLSQDEASWYFGLKRKPIAGRDAGMGSGQKNNRYKRIIEWVFFDHYKKGDSSVSFDRSDFEKAIDALDLKRPKNLGDIIYSVRFRTPMPDSVAAEAPQGKEWVIRGIGKGRYSFDLVERVRIRPNPDILTIKIPDATPEIVRSSAQGDEQALLALVRYNRLIDIFLGVTAYSLQNHLRTTAADIGQVEIDEVYVAVDRYGSQCVIPVQAKAHHDEIGVTQPEQDFAVCNEKWPDLTARPVAVQFMGKGTEGTIALFELSLVDGSLQVARESHYQLVKSEEISEEDLRNARNVSQSAIGSGEGDVLSL